MPAVSKAQQKFFGIVRAIQKGEMAPTTPETAKAAADMKKSDVKDFASTKHKKLPEKKVAKEATDFAQRDKIMKKAKPLHKHLYSRLHKKDSSGDVNEESNPRIPRKKGQPANSKKHSDLYTDENPKGTIHGLGFKDVATAKASVSKIRNSSRSHAHKIQAAVAMEQRAREMGKTSEAAVYRKYINSMKKKTKKMNEEIEIIEGSSIRQGQTSKKKVSYRGATSDVKRDKDGNIPASHYKKEKPNIVSIKRKDTRTDDQKKKHSDAVRKYDNYKKLQAKIFAKDDARKKANQEYAAKKKMNEGWSDKYKKSIDCNNPKGFSQRAHCQGKKKVSEETKYDRYDKEKKQFAKADRKMKFGKFYDKAKEAKNRLRPGEVKRYDKKLGRYVSNKE